MATPVVVPIILSDIVLVVGTDNYEAHVSTVRFEPTTPQVPWKGLTPTSVFNLQGSTTWSVTLTYAQDWATTNSLSQYLLAQAGTKKTVTFKPKKPATGTAPTWTATVNIAPGAIGGDVDTVPTATVTLGLDGPPVLSVV